MSSKIAFLGLWASLLSFGVGVLTFCGVGLAHLCGADLGSDAVRNWLAGAALLVAFSILLFIVSFAVDNHLIEKRRKRTFGDPLDRTGWM